LDDLYRIAHRDYEPTDDDVVRARLRTMGVQEYRFVFETGTVISSQFCIVFVEPVVKDVKQDKSGYFTTSVAREHT
jgi:hypothetical protein